MNKKEDADLWFSLVKHADPVITGTFHKIASADVIIHTPQPNSKDWHIYCGEILDGDLMLPIGYLFQRKDRSWSGVVFRGSIKEESVPITRRNGFSTIYAAYDWVMKRSSINGFIATTYMDKVGALSLLAGCLDDEK